VRGAIDSLDRLLADSDAQAQILWGESRQLVKPVLQGSLEAFEEAMEGFHFEAALYLLRESVAGTPELSVSPSS
jgi:hypothetical protein